jgi:hypothetical protein
LLVVSAKHLPTQAFVLTLLLSAQNSLQASMPQERPLTGQEKFPYSFGLGMGILLTIETVLVVEVLPLTEPFAS